MVLPTNIYTQWYWKTDLHNLIRFMKLRADPHAQLEIRKYAEVIENLVASWVPSTFTAYMNYIKQSMSFSAKEAQALALIMNTNQGRIMIDVLRKMDVEKLAGGFNFSIGEWKEFLVKIDNVEKHFSNKPI
jgi:thymidylate synthase (FAD)